MATPTVTIIHNEYGRQWREAISLRDFNPKKHVLADQPVEPAVEKAFKASKAKKKVKPVDEAEADFDTPPFLVTGDTVKLRNVEVDTQPLPKDDFDANLIDRAFDE